MTNNHPRYNGFLSLMIGPSGAALDRKLWRNQADAIKHIAAEAENHPQVAKAEIYEPGGTLVWTRSYQGGRSPSRRVGGATQTSEAQRARREEKHILKLVREYTSGKV